ncbi:hypothetical protein IscW_ISCW005545 [Ixodes scapularis]|uniref:DDE-1 domain-containing protein n=1 Tax=Ixodes scapularis TaxID=6945 RepID=B7PNK2_IXOSC|nr:hypothetical protein IscW_ISCW005545 [Ixodes scapularis]|eukprot:XP_002435350.1 hypothetical protein IscW_ISCW005545 [Ixodes scapularis]
MEVLFLPPNTTAKLQPMDQGVTANFEVHYHRRVVERRLIDLQTNVTPKDQKVTLAKAVQMVSGCQTPLLQATKRLPETTPLLLPKFVRRWNGSGETMAKDQLVPSGLDLISFLTTEDDVVATEEMIDEALVKCNLLMWRQVAKVTRVATTPRDRYPSERLSPRWEPFETTSLVSGGSD